MQDSQDFLIIEELFKAAICMIGNQKLMVWVGGRPKVSVFGSQTDLNTVSLKAKNTTECIQ